MKILITGGCGFVGHHLVEHLLKNTLWDIVILDRLDYASMGFDRLRDIQVFNKERVKIICHDLNLPLSIGIIKEIGNIDYIVHMGASSHVDNSIKDPIPFILNNVTNTLNMLEYAKQCLNLKKFIYFSTDEVFGSAPKGICYNEGDRFNPGNPYSASKASAENICVAYRNTYNLPIMITNTMNIIGERQHPEKFLPIIVKKLLNNEELLLHGNPQCTESGYRTYMHARTASDAVLFILKNVNEFVDNIDASKGKFNIVGEQETSNLEFALKVAKIMNIKLKYKIIDFHSSRPGHDLRYSLNNKKMLDLGWSYPMSLDESLKNTVAWMLNEKNKKWLYNV